MGDVTIDSATFVDDGYLIVQVTVAADAAPGSRTLTITNPDGTSTSLPDAFTITAPPPPSPPPPTVTSVAPNTQAQHTNGVGHYVFGTDFQPGATVAFSGTGVTVDSTSFNSSTLLGLFATVTGGAALTARTITVTNPDAQTGTLT